MALIISYWVILAQAKYAGLLDRLEKLERVRKEAAEVRKYRIDGMTGILSWHPLDEALADCKEEK